MITITCLIGEAVLLSRGKFASTGVLSPAKPVPIVNCRSAIDASAMRTPNSVLDAILRKFIHPPGFFCYRDGAESNSGRVLQRDESSMKEITNLSHAVKYVRYITTQLQ